ncbi:hypothetical protein EDB83DRAFT_2615886 [Lactarius deliciosus]|nr:hypothetical protein EDB83DRAFT_2615886 [Lactarius deliciosus]
MTYARIHHRDNPFWKNPLRAICRTDLASHPCLQVIDVVAGKEKWRVVNFYNDVEDPSAMAALMGLAMDPTIPTLVVGDFNIHSRTWSPAGWAPSTGAARLEEWAAAEGHRGTQYPFRSGSIPPDTIFVLCSDASALLTVKNIRNKTAQSSALLFHFSLTTLCTIHRNTSIVLVWTPTDHELEGQTVARHKATEACRCDPPGGVEHVQSAAYQKDCARQKAFQEWAAVWEKRQGEIRAGQRAASFADKITLTKPPDGNNHPLWSAATERTTTALQITVDHAFTGSYATRFRPADPPESLRCPCGEPLRSSSHALYQCQRYYFERHAYGVVRYGHTIPYNKLLSSHKKNALRFLTFLQETRALSRPETGPDAYVPPEPD